MPLEFLASRACARLSPQALKLLVDMVSQLQANAKRNGDLTAAFSVLQPRGWGSTATLAAAVEELVQARLLVVTRKGSTRRPHLYAITLWPLWCDQAKLDRERRAFTQHDWRAHGEDQPSHESPAQWRALRHGEKQAAGQKRQAIASAADAMKRIRSAADAMKLPKGRIASAAD